MVSEIELKVFEDNQDPNCQTSLHQDARGYLVKPPQLFDRVEDSFVTSSYPRVIRGFHILNSASVKVVTVLEGQILDVVVKKTGSRKVRIAPRIMRQGNYVLVQPKCAHGFQVTSNSNAVLHYQCSEPYDEALDVGFNPLSPGLLDLWKSPLSCIISERDRSLPMLNDWITDW